MPNKSKRVVELEAALEVAIGRLEHFWDADNPLGYPIGAYFIEEIERLYTDLYGRNLPEDVTDRLRRYRYGYGG